VGIGMSAMMSDSVTALMVRGAQRGSVEARLRLGVGVGEAAVAVAVQYE